MSRDLEDLGAVKVRVPGGETVYAIPEYEPDRLAPHDHLRRVLSEWVVEAGRSANLVVLRTPPGCAHVVASALDRSGLEGLLGTVAGDDTLLVRRGGEGRRSEAVDRAAEPGRADRRLIEKPDEETDVAKRVVLAYSGGLDTSVLVRWMQEEMGVEEVFCLCADVGQATTGDWDAVRERAFAAGRQGHRGARPARRVR